MNEYEIDVCHRHTIYDSDEDESSEPLGNNDLSFRPPNVEPPKGGTLVFALGRISSVFVRTYFEIESAPVFSVATNDSRRALKGHHFARGEADTPVSSVFSSSATVLVCLHEDELNADHCNTWCEGILTALRPEQVLVLQCLPLHEHVDPPASASCFLRSLHTSSWRQAPLATFLEAPNIIKGEAAASEFCLLTYHKVIEFVCLVVARVCVCVCVCVCVSVCVLYGCVCMCCMCVCFN